MAGGGSVPAEETHGQQTLGISADAGSAALAPRERGCHLMRMGGRGGAHATSRLDGLDRGSRWIHIGNPS